jgi:hypothetical protein
LTDKITSVFLLIKGIRGDLIMNVSRYDFFNVVHSARQNAPRESVGQGSVFFSYLKAAVLMLLLALTGTLTLTLRHGHAQTSSAGDGVLGWRGYDNVYYGSATAACRSWFDRYQSDSPCSTFLGARIRKPGVVAHYRIINRQTQSN